MCHWSYLLHAITSDCETRLLNVFGPTGMSWEIKKKYYLTNGTIFEGKLLNIEWVFWISLQLVSRPPLWSSGQSFWLQIQRSRVRFPALPDFLSSSGSGTGSTQPREVN